jgi:hypothetical protein
VFVQSYKELFEVSLQLRRRRPCILISYEQLAENIHILNEKLKGFCTFDFSNFSIKPTEFLFGDAQKDEITDIAQIKNNNRSYELVSEKELHIINNELNSIYQRVVVDKEKDPKLYRKVRNIIIK